MQPNLHNHGDCRRLTRIRNIQGPISLLEPKADLIGLQKIYREAWLVALEKNRSHSAFQDIFDIRFDSKGLPTSISKTNQPRLNFSRGIDKRAVTSAKTTAEPFTNILDKHTARATKAPAKSLANGFN